MLTGFHLLQKFFPQASIRFSNPVHASRLAIILRMIKLMFKTAKLEL
jgi:hypothetical protein